MSKRGLVFSPLALQQAESTLSLTSGLSNDMRIRKILLPLVVIGIGVMVFMYLKSTRPEAEPVSVEPNLPTVKARLAEVGSISPTLTLYGWVETPKATKISAAIAGELIEVAIKQGIRVEEGEILARIDDEDARLALLQKEAELEEIEAQIESDAVKFEYDQLALEREKKLLQLARKAVDRAKTLATNNLGSQAALDAARQSEQQQLLGISQRERVIKEYPARQKQMAARLQRARADKRRRARELEYTEIRAPFSGVISESMVAKGDWVNRGTGMFELYDDRQLEIRVQIPNRFIGTFNAGEGSGATLKASTDVAGNEIELRLDRVSTKITAGLGGLDAFFGLPEGVTTQLGRTLEIKVQLPARDEAMTLPVDALYGSNKIYLINAGKLVAKRVIRLGRHTTESGNEVIIDGAGFSGDERILVSRLPQAIEGLEVRVDDQEN